MPPPSRIAIAPSPVPEWVQRAVEEGGGVRLEPQQAEALVWTDPFGVDELREVLAANPHITWVQLPWAGVEEFAAAGMFGDDRVWTCGKGAYAEPVAEHALGLALYGLRDLHVRTRATAWGEPSGRSLFDGRVTIVGGGGITEALLRLLAPFRLEATVVRRQAEAPAGGTGVTVRVEPPDRLHAALATADVVFLTLALTPETAGIMGAAEFEAMPRHAWLVNVARGRHVKTDELVDALRDGVIAGAALDVTDPEPLPAGHPLWDLPNCLITPHCANTPEMAVAPLSARIRENVWRFRNDAPLVGVVDPALGY